MVVILEKKKNADQLLAPCAIRNDAGFAETTVYERFTYHRQCRTFTRTKLLEEGEVFAVARKRYFARHSMPVLSPNSVGTPMVENCGGF